MDGTELRQYAEELLADGEWHDYHVIVSQIAGRVTPGRAMRRVESQRKTGGKNLHGGRENVPPRSMHKDTDILIRIGAQHIAKQLLNRKKHFEIDPPGQAPPGQKFVRLRRTAVATEPSDQLEMLIDLLADGEWHDYHIILAQVARTVNPGAAVRMTEQQRAWSSERRLGKAKPRVKPISRQDEIRSGAMMIVRARLSNSIFEIKPPGRVPVGEPKWIRLNPSYVPVATGPGGGRYSPPMRAALQLLRDREWHDWDEVLGVATAAVPEARALSYFQAQHKRRPRKGPLPAKEEQIRIGAHGTGRAVLVDNLMILVERVDGKPVRARLRRPTDG